MPKTFPKEYPAGMDLDIITTPKDFNQLINKTLEFAKKSPHFKLKILRNNKNILIRINKRQITSIVINITTYG
mgnify:CR=1 FL=1